MDPEECLEDLCHALRNDDEDAAHVAGENLSNWMNSGGFMPAITRKQFCTLLNNILMYVEITHLTGEERL